MRRRSGLTGANRDGWCWYSADAYLFDIDGTLLRCYDRTHRSALHWAMGQVFGVETTIDGIAYHGKTDLGILRAALERAGVAGSAIDSGMADALAVTRRYVADNRRLLTPTLMPGIPQILELLRSLGKLLAICSGNLETVGWLKVRAARLDEFFQFGCFADPCELRACVFRQGVIESRRRLGPAASVCFIGDTPDDVKAAQKVGGRIIAVGTGTYLVSELAAHEPDLCVASCDDLLVQDAAHTAPDRRC
ncbi:MAG TPA: HAD family hydrolase [Terriglobales bacterium]|nr:HAD family hydrolase [Terriglobales bacterium]